MATEKTFTLNLDDGNAKTYASASTLTLGTNDIYARLYLNGGSTGYATLNDAAKAVLYPTATAKPFKVDSEMRVSRNVGGTADFQLQFAGTSVHTQSTKSSSYSTYSASSTASVVTNSTRSTQIRHYLHVSSTLYGARLLWANITLHFYQYSCSAQKGNSNDGINSVSCSSTAPYTGDPVTWSVSLKDGAQWSGWYSDAACTNLVSTDQSYTITPNTDKTLYAKATLPSYSLSAGVATGTNAVSAVSASVSSAKHGTSVSVSVTAFNTSHYNWKGWYSDAGHTNLVSASQTYTFALTGNTTLYAYAVPTYYVTVGMANDHDGVTSVSPNSGYFEHGASVTVNVTLRTGAQWYGWYSDAAASSLVSSNTPYTFTVSSTVSLYAKAVQPGFTCSVTGNAGGNVECRISQSEFQTTDWSSSPVTYKYGDTIQIRAAASSGYFFLQWSGYSEADGSTLTIRPTSNVTYTAIFNQNSGLYVKINGVQRPVARVFKKISNSYIQVSDIGAELNTNVGYMNGG